MRIRTVKPGFFLHEALGELPPVTRLAFIGLWCAADREGRLKWKPKSLKVQILPWDDVNFSLLMEDLVQEGLLVKYEVDGQLYGWIKGFHEHQRVQTREAESTIPAPPQALQVKCPGTAGALQVHCPGTAVQKGKGREGKGKEGKEYTVGNPTGVDHPETLQRILSIFRKRKGTTTRKLDSAEASAWKKIQGSIQDDDLELVERFYSEPKSKDCDQTWKRKLAPAQLMNQWHSQVDLAGAFYEGTAPGKGDPSEW